MSDNRSIRDIAEKFKNSETLLFGGFPKSELKPMDKKVTCYTSIALVDGGYAKWPEDVNKPALFPVQGSNYKDIGCSLLKTFAAVVARSEFPDPNKDIDEWRARYKELSDPLYYVDSKELASL